MSYKNMVIIQARMGSKRLPGKSMETIGDEPLINHVVRRALAINDIHKVVLATTRQEEDDVLALHVEAEFGVQIHRGDSEDVRSRFIDVINKFHPENVIRLTADDPFKDPKLAEDALRMLIAEDLDYVSNFAPPTLPIGFDVEAFTSRALIDSLSDFRSKEDIEHVTPALRNSGKYKTKSLAYEGMSADFRLTIDFPEDLEKCRAIHKLLEEVSPDDYGYKTTCKVIKSMIKKGET
jgi:spore coat polysaccharide biosynthesis protein SpsF (cytidylyltransferase family)